MSRPRGARCALVATLLVLASCVRLTYAVRYVQEPITDPQLEGLQARQDDLTSCLAKLGAPQFVWEYAVDGVALGWVFLDSAGWSFSVSYDFWRFTSASFRWDDDATDLPGVVVWFDGDLRLLKWRRGQMSEISSGLRRRPAAVEQIYGADGG